jgi:hypothetical protein
VFGCPPNSKFDEWHGFSLPTDEYWSTISNSLRPPFCNS